VHDGLAALVLSARVALAKKGLESTHEHLDRLLRRASELLEAPSGPLGGELASVLHNFESDAPGQISHQVTTGAELRLVIRAPREVLERGRGVRSARLRAWARGGTVRREGDTLVVCWLSKVPRTSSNSSRISLGVLACGAVVSFASGLVQVAAISAGISVLCFVLYRSMELPARRDQALSAREFARSRLEPSLAALRAARSTSSAEHVGAALNTLSHSIVDVVHELEAAPRYTSLPALTLH
jgi:hypothetical protein